LGIINLIVGSFYKRLDVVESLFIRKIGLGLITGSLSYAILKYYYYYYLIIFFWL